MAQNQPDPRSNNSAIDEPIDQRIIAATNHFGLTLFSYLQQRNSTQNLLISPFSVAIALSMTYNGASGETQRAMAKTLHLQDMSLDEVNRANADLAVSLKNADPTIMLAIANSLWAQERFTFQPAFLQRNQTFYTAEIATLDFGSPEARSQINHWVNQNTAGKIPDIVDHIHPDTVLFLVNAVYFKGNWATPFDASQTCDRPFYLLDGTSKLHPMMMQHGQYRYHETENFQAISLPYGNGRLSMYIVLPKPNSSLAEFYATLTPDYWNHWTELFSICPGSLQLPKFTFEYSQSLNEALGILGMEIAFSGDADFSKLSDEPTAISEVRHKTFIEVNEEGTEAAAATSVAMVRTSMPVHPPFQMTIDRPFFFAIRDDQTKALLFMGSVVEPN